jgi:ankyrin repeat domain-containing protein 17
VDVNACDAIFGTPLVAAARAGHAAVATALLRRPELLPDRRSQRDTALTACVANGHLECAKALVASGRCDVNLPQEATACASGHKTTADDPLTIAAKRGDRELVKLLVARGARVNGGGEGTCDIPLTAATTAGHVDVVMDLLNAGADVNGVARWAGRTALVAAAESEDPRTRTLVDVFLRRGADANHVSSGIVGRRLGYGAVHAAAARMDAEMVRALVKAGADPNRRAKNTDSKEVKSRRANAAKQLWGVNTAPDRLDNTPLHLAVALYINEAAKRRVKERDAREAEEKSGGDPSDAKKGGEKEKEKPSHPPPSKGGDDGVPGPGEKLALDVVKTLLECGADHNAFVVDSTPMHMASLGGACDVVDLLMSKGADVDAAAPGCTTPLEAATRYAADLVVDARDSGAHDGEPEEYDSDDADLPDLISGEESGAKKVERLASMLAAEKHSEKVKLKMDLTVDDGTPPGARSVSEEGVWLAMEALRDAAGPLRAARHLASKWKATVTTAALVGACRAGDEETTATLLDAASNLIDERAKKEGEVVAAADRSPRTMDELVKGVARHTTPLHAAAEARSIRWSPYDRVRVVNAVP